MKKFLKNLDGTYKVINCSLFSMVLTIVILGILSIPLFLKDKAEDYTGTERTTNVQGADISSCKECDIEFFNKKMTIASGERIKVKDMLDLKEVDLINVKFEYDEKYLKKEQIDGEYYFAAGDYLGDVTLKATYKEYTTSVKITITSDTIKDASFDKDVYYIYKGSSSKIGITTSPVGADHKLLDLASSDEDIVTFDKDNKIVGVKPGVATITLTIEREVVPEKTTSASNSRTDEEEVTKPRKEVFVDTATVYVSVNMLTVKAKIDGVYKEMDDYKYTTSADSYNLYIAVRPEDNEKKGYTDKDVTYEVKNNGSLDTTVSFESVYSADSSTYIYKAVIKYDASIVSNDNSSVITFKLPDGSLKLFKIYK